MAKTNVKVDIPSNRPDDLIILGDTIEKKNTELADASPLKSLNMAALKAGLTAAKAKREEASMLHKRAEKLNQEANLALGLGESQNSKTPDTVLNIIISARDVLLGINRGKEEALNDWGFNVVNGSLGKKKTS